jgi:hypothetical protein
LNKKKENVYRLISSNVKDLFRKIDTGESYGIESHVYSSSSSSSPSVLNFVQSICLYNFCDGRFMNILRLLIFWRPASVFFHATKKIMGAVSKKADLQKNNKRGFSLEKSKII